MKALISDIHSNLEALQAVLEDIKERLALQSLTLGMKNIDYVQKNMI